MPRQWPDDLADEGRFGSAALRARAEPSYPAADSYDVEQVVSDPWSMYANVLGDEEEPTTRFLGNPDPVQGDMQVDCQLASNGIDGGDSSYLRRRDAQALLPGAAAWRLLLQVDSHEDETDMMWGDMGRLYFWIKDADLAAGRWDEVWACLQCG